jgi:hypothetical protein
MINNYESRMRTNIRCFVVLLMPLMMFATTQVASAFYDPSLQRWINRDPLGGMVSIKLILAQNHTTKIAHGEAGYEGPNLYKYAFNAPIALTDQNGLWTIGIGVQGSYGFGFAGGISGGVYFCHGPNGWSFGLLGGPFLGSGGFSVGAGGFLQVTSAKCVSALKGIGGQVGASGGEVVTGGGDIVFGDGYGGLEIGVGVGAGTPIEVHGGGTVTIGPVWGAGSK